ncbi:MAG TPA: hypothetical protein VJO35_08275 [Terriglobales bacterium]|nr:hypothetical protein [Terriglobales bacterium]
MSLESFRIHRSKAPLIAVFLLTFSFQLLAQQPNVDAQRDAMRRLSFLVGHWSGPVTISRGPANLLHLTQTEDVAYKLDGLVLLIEGKSTGPDGKIEFSAFATVAYDDASHAYRFRAYNDGRYLDTELSVPDRGFAWGFTAGPAHITNTMHLTQKGEWDEVTEVTFGSNPPHHSVEMLLEKQP